MPKKQSGCVPFQRPKTIIDLETGEVIDDAIIRKFLELVLEEAKIFSDRHKEEICKVLSVPENRVSAPVGTAWKGGLKHDYTRLDKSFKQRSRIGRVILHRVMTDWTSYYENPDEKKEEPTFEVLKAVLGAVDRQMATVSYDFGKAEAILDWQCLDRELRLFFDIPSFILHYDIASLALPTIHCIDGRVLFDFPFEENLDYRCLHSKNRVYAGYDLGRVKPFALTVINRFGERIAVYEASSRLCELSRRREANIAKRKDIASKLAAFEVLGIEIPEGLLDEYERLRADISVAGGEIAEMTGAEIAALCEKHDVVCCFGEDLSAVDEWAGRSSRWVHGKQQEWIIRLARRVGCAHMFVRAAGTSQECAKCGSSVSHDSLRRTSSCRNADCSFTEDRDKMTSWVVAKRGIVSFTKYLAKVLANR